MSSEIDEILRNWDDLSDEPPAAYGDAEGRGGDDEPPASAQVSPLGTIRVLAPGEGDTEETDGQKQFANITLTDTQNAHLKTILRNIDQRVPVTKLGGYAGTGKSALLGVLAQAFGQRKLSVAYVAPTGKAASVLRRSLGAQGVVPAFSGTVHRLMYRPVVDGQGTIKSFSKIDKLPVQVIVVDEASMVPKKMAEDLESFGIPVLYVGDHGQLPPVGEAAGLMENPDLRLEEVMRQALDSPIIALSFLFRRGGDWRRYVKDNSSKGALERVSPFDYMEYCVDHFKDFTDRPMSEDPLLITHTNAQRVEMNSAVRISLGTDKLVVPGERLIVLKNAYLTGSMIANGFRGKVGSTLYSRNHHTIRMNVAFTDEGLALDNGLFNAHQLGRSQTFKKLDEIKGGPADWNQAGLLADYGYCLTAHKAQGSQAKKVIVKMDRGFMKDDEWKRWGYTAITRAQEQCALIF